MALLDYYGILQVAEDAGDDVIRAAYRALAARLAGSPPASQAAAEMALVQEAYTVLSDPAMRTKYDQVRREVVEDQIARRAAEWERFSEEHRLPNIRMTPDLAEAIGRILADCPPHVCDVYRLIMERWEKAKQGVDATPHAIGLKLASGAPGRDVAGLLPIDDTHPALIVLGWESLRCDGVFPGPAVDRFQAAVSKFAPIEVTESSAHIHVTPAFTVERARALMRALVALASTAQAPAPKRDVVWDSTLPRLDAPVGPVSLENIQNTLLACEPGTREKYALLINGWSAAGGTVQCSSPGRIYLRLKTATHKLAMVQRAVSHNFTLLALAAPKAHRPSAIDVAWSLCDGELPYLDYIPEAVRRFENTIAALPGYKLHGVVHSVELADEFSDMEAQALLIAILDLKAASDQAANPLDPPQV